MHSHLVCLSAISLFSSTFASPLNADSIAPGTVSGQQVHNASVDNGGFYLDGISTLDGAPIESVPEGRSAEAVMAAAIAPQAAWTATADSFQPGYPPSNVLDGNTNTYWHTPFGANGNPLPHQLTIDMKQAYLINSVAYIPRQDGSSNGNIGEHVIATSLDGINFANTVATGTYRDDASTKTTIFEATNARFVRITSLTEAGGRGPWTSVASLSIFQTTVAAPPHGQGEWSPTIDFPLVPVSMALEHDTGRVLAWSSYAASTFGGSPGGNTLTNTYDPATGIVSQRNVYETDHDMFCEGLSMDMTGRVLATGGNNAPKASLYSPKYDAWTALSPMNTPRGYQAQATLSDGRIFTIGGSWSGGDTVDKNGEVFDPYYDTWTPLPNALARPMYTADQQGQYRADNHAWLFGWKNGYVFQAGPSKAMNWYGTTNGGSQVGAGNRGDDGDSMCGNAVMYDAAAGKILTIGGATSYQGVDATANAHIISINGPNTNPVVQTINPMWYQRIFANAVVLPNGNVFITGGQVHGQPFSDDTAQLQPEMWDPVTTRFTKLASQAVPRTYHSTALLLPDATIISGGGGLCGACATNHYDAQVYSPAYLFNPDGSRAARPVILNAPAQVAITNPRSTLTATTNVPVSSWSLIRLGSTTHTVNTDQRRIPLYGTNNGNTYTLALPTDPGIFLPGYYMLFAMNAQGTPSIAKFVWVPVP